MAAQFGQPIANASRKQIRALLDKAEFGIAVRRGHVLGFSGCAAHMPFS
jgi:hypothetical protein